MSKTKQYLGTGRRKGAICTAVLTVGSGRIQINRDDHEDYMQHRQVLVDMVRAPLNHLKPDPNFDVRVRVHGGGLVGQAGAVRLAISRALVEAESDYRQPLRRVGYLTQDARVKERKKYGLKKARKSPQFSKR